VKGTRGREFVSRKTGHPLVASFQPFDFAYWYDRGKDYIEDVAAAHLEGPSLTRPSSSARSNRRWGQVAASAVNDELPLRYDGSGRFSRVTSEIRSGLR
jgi:hypothetical protein